MGAGAGTRQGWNTNNNIGDANQDDFKIPERDDEDQDRFQTAGD